MPQVGAALEQNPGIGLDIMIILGENGSGGKPSLTYCQQYADSHGVAREKTFIDNGIQYGGWETTFTYMNPYLGADGSLALPWDAILDGDNMEYLFCSGNPTTYPGVNEAIEAALSD